MSTAIQLHESIDRANIKFLYIAVGELQRPVSANHDKT